MSSSILFNPGSVAVVGASSDPKKLNGRPVGYLQKHGFAGRIFPINPRYDAIGDLKCYASPGDLPEAPDVGLVLVGAERAIESVRQLSEIDTKTAIVLASGFGEAGEEGRARQAALKDAAGGMRLLGPNTIGLVNLSDGIMLTATGAMEMEDFTSGNIALISQSGGILGSLLSRAAARGIGFSKLVATGNEVDLDVADFLDAIADDDATKVAALYLETIRNADKFRAAAERATAAGKRIVAYKVGRSESGATAAVSHTGALAGADEVYDAFFAQLGIIRAQTFSDLLDIPSALSGGRTMKGNRAAIVTSTGGAATIVADNIGLTELETPQPDPDTAKKLAALDLQDAVLDRNPIDVTLAGLRPDLFREILRILVESDTYEAVVTIVGSSSLGNPDVVAVPVSETLELTDKPLLAYVSPDAPHIVKHLNQRGIPAYATPESCAPALLALRAPHISAKADQRELPDVVCTYLPAGTMNEVACKDLFQRFGISVPATKRAATPEEVAELASSFGGPVVVKILSDEIAHKSEVGGVAVGIAPDDVATCCSDMLARVKKATSAKIDGFLIEECVTGGVELILGFNRDPQLGPYVLLGAGGVTTELYKDVAMRLLPLDRADARNMIDQLKSSALLRGFRGRPVADIEALIDAILAFADMAMVVGDRLAEAEINPIFVLPKGDGVRAGDGLVILT